MDAALLAQVDWPAAVAALEERPGALPAGVLSLAALYTPGFQAARARLRRAARAEPLSPLHELREALLCARFGELAAAAAVLDRLRERLPDRPLVDYLRGVLALRAGRADQARAIAASLETAHPGFVPARFLRAEVQLVLAPRPGAVKKFLVALPAGVEWEPLWADLLAKVALLHPREGPALAREHLEKRLPAGSPARGAVLRALALAGAPLDALRAKLEQAPPGSRAEALVVECMAERIADEDDEAAALAAAAALRQRHPERAALRALHTAQLARRAVALSSRGEHELALRAVEGCLREQPHDPVHHQNRAALFTLLREPAPYHESWAALNRHQYRLALLGAADAFTLEQVARTHRLFAQDARGGDGRRGVFRRVEPAEAGERPRLATDRDEIAADPDLLRQWLHHARAEVVFRHCLLGDDGDRALLHPADPDQAAARAEGLAAAGESLAVLVPEEGAALAGRLAGRWRAAAAAARTRYAAAGGEADAAVRQLEERHLELLADLHLLCRQWRPEPGQLSAAEELLDFVRAEAPFLDEAVLARVEEEAGYETPYPLQALSSHVARVAGGEKGRALGAEQRQAVADALLAALLVRMADAACAGHGGTQQEAALRALEYVDRARACAPADPEVQLAAAHYLMLGEFDDEARLAVERFRRRAEPDDEPGLAEAAAQIEEILHRRRREGKAGGRRPGAPGEDAPAEGREPRIAELAGELEHAPTAWRLYEELMQELAAAGRFDEAVQWADRAVAHCLGRADQMNARALAIEARGIRLLAQTSPRAAQLYVVGAHGPARAAIEALPGPRPEYPLLYLLGKCQLAAGSPGAARATFTEAAGACERQLHRTVLRHLAENIDNAYLAVERSAVHDALRQGALEEAAQRAAAVFPRLQEPAGWLVDFARVFYGAAIARIGAGGAPLPLPRLALDAPWAGRAAAALAAGDDADRALALALLAEALHPPSAPAARLLAERARALRQQCLAADALGQAGRLLGERRFGEVLALLDGMDEGVRAEPRLVRVRTLALLGLHRFAEADALVAGLGDGGGGEIRAFVRGYPALACRQRLATAQPLLREGKAEEALEALRGAVPGGPRDAADLAYCHAFAEALAAYRLRREGRGAEARARFLAALRGVEPHLAAATAHGQPHLTELYDRLEREVESDA